MSILKKTGQKGQMSILGMMEAVIGLVMLTALLPVVNQLVGTIVAGNMSAFSGVDSINLILGMTGILLVVMVLYSSVVKPFTNPQVGGM